MDKTADLLSSASDRFASEVLTPCRPFSQRRRGAYARLIVGAIQPTKNDTLIANIARAKQWRTSPCNADNLAVLAARDGITVKCLSEMLQFGFLAP